MSRSPSTVRVILPPAASSVGWLLCPVRVVYSSQLSVAIKSAARREVTRFSSKVPQSLLASAGTGQAQFSEERVAERCLLVGMAR